MVWRACHDEWGLLPLVIAACFVGCAGSPSAAKINPLVAELEKPIFIRLPVTRENIFSVFLLLALAVLGSVYVFKLLSRKSCVCALCTGEYELVDELGKGGFGRVYTVRLRNDPVLYVLKKIPVNDLNHANSAQAEAKQLRTLNHRHIVGFVDDFLHSEPQHGLKRLESALFVCIVMEHCDFDLQEYISSNKLEAVTEVPVAAAGVAADDNRRHDHVDVDHAVGDGTADDHGDSVTSDIVGTSKANSSSTSDGDNDDDLEDVDVVVKELITLLAQTASALAYCHERDIIHRDVKPSNVFLKAGEARLGDFGLCRRWTDPAALGGDASFSGAAAGGTGSPGRPRRRHHRHVPRSRMNLTTAGTEFYRPPELFSGERADYKQVDVWCFGLLCVELLTSKFVYERAGLIGARVLENPAYVETIIREIPEYFPEELRATVRAMLQSPAKMRPPIRKVAADLDAMLQTI